jgi:hypothetical protein
VLTRTRTREKSLFRRVGGGGSAAAARVRLLLERRDADALALVREALEWKDVRPTANTFHTLLEFMRSPEDVAAVLAMMKVHVCFCAPA